MHADLSRRTFDPALGFRSVVMQQGRVLLDAEWNEQADIAAHHDEARTADIVGPSGGPEPADGGPGPFAIVALDGTDLTSNPVPWEQLGVTPGRYYIDGVLAESLAPPPPAVGWPLGDQPFLRAIGPADPGLVEPADGRYAAYLHVFDDLVTADERPELRESALGGPDTAARERTVWQVRLEALDAGEVCSQLAALPPVEPRTMVASLEDADPAADPCDISTGGGYRRLENQLYRVEVFDTDPQPRFVWSRENGSVVAGLVDIGTTSVAGMDAALTLDRVGRDPELSIGPDDLVEITSEDRRLRALPGLLARVGRVDDLTLHVKWDAASPTSLDALGVAPIVRRWDGGGTGSGPFPLSAAPRELEDGVVVRFPAGGTARVGDHWLIPARTVRLATGLTARAGTIEWPQTESGPAAAPPTGPDRHRASLGILVKSAAGWTLDADCRNLFPPLTALTAIDLVGGDGQEAMPADELDEPVRVVVRRGERPVAGAMVRFTAEGGGIREAVSGLALANPDVVTTGADGVAAVRWTLDPAGAPTQRLIAQRLDDTAAPVDVAVIATGRLSVAREVAWDPACRGFAETRTVQDALARLVTTQDLRLLGGDGQEVTRGGTTVPQLVRVVVDSPCGPVEGEKVIAECTDGALVDAVADGSAVPPTLDGTPAGSSATAVTDSRGVAAFVWQPVFPQAPPTDRLTISTESDPAGPIKVYAQRDAGGGRRLQEGLHIVQVLFRDGSPLENDSHITARSLSKGIMVELDGDVMRESVDGKPVGRLLIEVPYPTPAELRFFGDIPQSFATHAVALHGTMLAEGNFVIWQPRDDVVLDIASMLSNLIQTLHSWEADNLIPKPAMPLLMRFQLDGWAILSADQSLQVNTHAMMKSDGARTVFSLPTDDLVAGGTFETWFHLVERRIFLRVGGIELEPFIGRTLAFAQRRAEAAGLRVEVREEDAPGQRRNTVLGTIPAEGEVAPGATLVIRVARGG